MQDEDEVDSEYKTSSKKERSAHLNPSMIGKKRKTQYKEESDKEEEGQSESA